LSSTCLPWCWCCILSLPFSVCLRHSHDCSSLCNLHYSII
jgi:hypothetical protein